MALRLRFQTLYHRAGPILLQSRMVALNSIEKGKTVTKEAIELSHQFSKETYEKSRILSKEVMEKGKLIGKEVMIKGRVLGQEAVTQGKILSQEALEKGKVVLEKGSRVSQQYLEKVQTNFEKSPLPKNLSVQKVVKMSIRVTQWTVENSFLLAKMILQKSLAFMIATEQVICGPLRSYYLITKSFLQQVYHIQELGPPAFDTWPQAKQSYRNAILQLSNKNVLDYTWSEIVHSSRISLEILAFYYVGEALGSGLCLAFLG